MAIYGRSGEPVTIVRRAVLDDVRALDGRTADQQDRDSLKSASYVVVRFEDGAERLYHLAYLRADDGSAELQVALDAVLRLHVHQEGDEPIEDRIYTLAAFVADNADGLDAHQICDLRLLPIGESLAFGGGAAPQFVVTAVRP